MQTQTTTKTSALDFFEAVLTRDTKTLRLYGVSKGEADAIDLDMQITVASKLLQADNTKQRAISKRVLAAEVLGTNPPAVNTIVTPKVKPVFNPNPSTLKVVAS